MPTNTFVLCPGRPQHRQHVVQFSLLVPVVHLCPLFMQPVWMPHTRHRIHETLHRGVCVRVCIYVPSVVHLCQLLVQSVWMPHIGYMIHNTLHRSVCVCVCIYIYVYHLLFILQAFRAAKGGCCTQSTGANTKGKNETPVGIGVRTQRFKCHF
jgi:hypothetical protein